MRVLIRGAGVLGRLCAIALVRRGAEVQLVDPKLNTAIDSAGSVAAGMIAPLAEAIDTHLVVAELGKDAVSRWDAISRTLDTDLGLRQSGSLMVAHRADAALLSRFSARASNQLGKGNWLDGQELGTISKQLAERFDRAFYLPGEGYLEPARFFQASLVWLQASSASLFSDESQTKKADYILDCTGASSTYVRKVRGEVVELFSREFELELPIRLMHPRVPLYLVPRGEGRYVLGASQLESDDASAISVRSALELLSAVYSLHPCLAEANILSMKVGHRPAFSSNLPELHIQGNTLMANGLYRHGFLLGPWFAEQLVMCLSKLARGDSETQLSELAAPYSFIKVDTHEVIR